MFANARMYSVSAAAAGSWRQLFTSVAQRAAEIAETAETAETLDIIDYPAPAPLRDLWNRPDKGAVFMCGLPYSRAVPRPHLLAAPVPSPAQFRGRPEYWSEFVVRAESDERTLSDTFGGRIALTSVESQSGFAAPLRHLRAAGSERPLFAALIAPQVTPQGALAAVADGLADVAAIDSYTMQLLRRHDPQRVSRVRVIDRTEPRPIPPLVAARPLPALAAAFLSAHEPDSLSMAAMADLLLERFVLPSPAGYAILSSEYDSTLDYWRGHALAAKIHPAFASILAA